MKKSTKILIISLSVAVIFVVTALIVGLSLLATYFRTTDSRGNEYATVVQMTESAQKAFMAGEVAKIGPYDVTATAQKDYKPSQTELDTIEKELNRKQRFNTQNDYPDNVGYSLVGESGQFVLVTLNLKYDQARSAYDRLSTSSKNWVRQMDSMALNDMSALVITPQIDDYQTSQEFTASTKSSEGAVLTLLYRLPKATDSLTLHYDITIFTKVSSLVGTEGMPRKEYEYTIGIQ